LSTKEKKNSQPPRRWQPLTQASKYVLFYRERWAGDRGNTRKKFLKRRKNEIRPVRPGRSRSVTEETAPDTHRLHQTHTDIQQSDTSSTYRAARVSTRSERVSYRRGARHRLLSSFQRRELTNRNPWNVKYTQRQAGPSNERKNLPKSREKERRLKEGGRKSVE
jgi:hypothetical protein